MIEIDFYSLRTEEDWVFVWGLVEREWQHALHDNTVELMFSGETTQEERNASNARYLPYRDRWALFLNLMKLPLPGRVQYLSGASLEWLFASHGLELELA